MLTLPSSARSTSTELFSGLSISSDIYKLPHNCCENRIANKKKNEGRVFGNYKTTTNKQTKGEKQKEEVVQDCAYTCETESIVGTSGCTYKGSLSLKYGGELSLTVEMKNNLLEQVNQKNPLKM